MPQGKTEIFMKKNAFYKIRCGIDLFDDTFVNACL